MCMCNALCVHILSYSLLRTYKTHVQHVRLYGLEWIYYSLMYVQISYCIRNNLPNNMNIFHTYYCYIHFLCWATTCFKERQITFCEQVTIGIINVSCDYCIILINNLVYFVHSKTLNVKNFPGRYPHAGGDTPPEATRLDVYVHRQVQLLMPPAVLFSTFRPQKMFSANSTTTIK